MAAGASSPGPGARRSSLKPEERGAGEDTANTDAPPRATLQTQEQESHQAAQPAAGVGGIPRKRGAGSAQLPPPVVVPAPPPQQPAPDSESAPPQVRPPAPSRDSSQVSAGGMTPDAAGGEGGTGAGSPATSVATSTASSHFSRHGPRHGHHRSSSGGGSSGPVRMGSTESTGGGDWERDDVVSLGHGGDGGAGDGRGGRGGGVGGVGAGGGSSAGGAADDNSLASTARNSKHTPRTPMVRDGSARDRQRAGRMSDREGESPRATPRYPGPRDREGTT